MDLAFWKMHGLGNDFVVIEDLTEDLDLSPEAVQWFCDRNFGIGGDGVILVRPATVEGADYFMLYYNADGTTAEMCGNGVRCFAKYLVDAGVVGPLTSRIIVQTLGGLKPVDVERAPDGTLSIATVDMGSPVLEPAMVPTTLVGEQEGAPAVDVELETELGQARVTCVSMGNPHAVIVVDDVDGARVDELGPLVETDTHFPRKTNVEFVQLMGDDRVRLRVWERGVGETLACGTGACATVVALTLLGHLDREATVELPGGELFIRWAEDGSVYMSGPAAVAFRGFVGIGEDESECATD